MESTIHITAKDKEINPYFQKNPEMFNELLKVIREHRNIKKSLMSKYRIALREWIITSTPLLNDTIYSILTRAYWIIYGIVDWTDSHVICPQCGKPFIGKNIYRLRLGYSERCSIDCMNKSQNHISKVKDTFHMHCADDPNFLMSIVKKSKETKVKNGHTPTWTNPELCKETKKKKYGDANFNNIPKARQTRYSRNDGNWHPSDYVEKNKKTCFEHNGYECALSYAGKRNTFDDKAIRQKALQTKRSRFTFNKSKEEDKAFDMLCLAFGKENIERQYMTDAYPYCCDFYIKTLDIYLEYNGSWTHGRHAYNEDSIDDQAFLAKWKEKCRMNSNKKHNYYERAIYVWTKLDVNKRNIAKANGLNFVEVWTLAQLQDWLSTNKGKSW